MPKTLAATRHRTRVCCNDQPVDPVWMGVVARQDLIWASQWLITAIAGIQRWPCTLEILARLLWERAEAVNMDAVS